MTPDEIAATYERVKRELARPAAPLILGQLGAFGDELVPTRPVQTDLFTDAD